MIRVNLLPYELRPIKRTPVPYFASAAVCALALAGVGLTYLANLAEIAGAQRLLDQHTSELTRLQPVVEEYNALSAQKNQLAEQVQTIEEIASDRTIWSRQLYNLSRLTLDNQWYKGVNVAMRQFEEQRKMPNPTTGKIEYQTVQVPKQVLTISGYVIPGSEGTSDMSPLAQGFAEDDEFAQLFELDKASFTDTIIDNTAVREFVLEYIIRQSRLQEAVQ
jgi:Tfp pilus assembly protein PilN